MKDCYLVLWMAAFVAISCAQGHTGEIYERHWNNPDHFVMEVPTEEQISAWKQMCEIADSACNRFEVESCHCPVDSYVAFSDITPVLLETDESDLDEFFSFVCWRLNELLPVDVLGGERARYDALTRQMDELSAYAPDCNCDMVNMEAIQTFFELSRWDYYSSRLAEEFPELKKLFQKEKDAFVEYKEGVCNAYENIVLGDPSYWGSIIPLFCFGFAHSIASQGIEGVAPTFLAVTDPGHAADMESHADVTEDMIKDAYTKFMDALVDPVFPEYEDMVFSKPYRLKGQQKALKKDMDSWGKWMRARTAVASQLPAAARRIYDNSTNEIRRHKLVDLLNLYKNYGLYDEDFLDSLLKYDCSDEELMNEIKK